MGTNVQIVMSPVRKLARVGRPRSRSASSARASDRSSSTGASGERRRCPRPAASPSPDGPPRCPRARRNLFVLPGFVAVPKRPALAVPAASALAHPCAVCGPASSSRVTCQAVRPARPAGRPGRCRRWRGRRTGSVPPKSRSSSRHGHPEQEPVDAGAPGAGFDAVEFPGSAVGPSRPQRTPVPANQRSTRERASWWCRGRSAGDTGSREAKSSTSDAVTLLPASSSRWAATASSGLVWRSERSASRARSSGAPARPAAPKVALTRGANSSMSGHITITSRGSSVGSSASRCRTASRTTSTWRARPWQEWTRRLSSSSASSGRGSSASPAPCGPGGGPVGADVRLDQARAGSWAVSGRERPGGCRRSPRWRPGPAASRGRRGPRSAAAGFCGQPRRRVVSSAATRPAGAAPGPQPRPITRRMGGAGKGARRGGRLSPSGP